MLSRLPVDEQLAWFRALLSRNEVLLDVLGRAAALALPGWYLTSGCLFQTVWNVLADREPGQGIRDYDLFYFDRTDLSWAAEDVVIKTAESVFAGVGAEVEVRNEARVHLWYERKFGVPCPPHTCTEDAIDSFLATTCCLGVRVETDGRWRVYAPHGFADVFTFVVRPNPVLGTGAAYAAKTVRWQREWPRLRVLPWPARASAGTAGSPHGAVAYDVIGTSAEGPESGTPS